MWRRSQSRQTNSCMRRLTISSMRRRPQSHLTISSMRRRPQSHLTNSRMRRRPQSHLTNSRMRRRPQSRQNNSSMRRPLSRTNTTPMQRQNTMTSGHTPLRNRHGLHDSRRLRSPPNTSCAVDAWRRPSPRCRTKKLSVQHVSVFVLTYQATTSTTTKVWRRKMNVLQLKGGVLVSLQSTYEYQSIDSDTFFLFYIGTFLHSYSL